MPFTKLTNVPVKESITGNEKIIINDDGVTRQTNIPNYVKTIGGVTPDQNGNVEIDIGDAWPSDLLKPSEGGYGYTESGAEIILVDGTFYYADSSEPLELTREYSLVEGQSYNVTFNGTEYNNLVAFDDGGYISIGGIYGDYSDYPFHIENGEDISDRLIVFFAEMPGDYSLVVTTEGPSEIHQIQRKYISIPSELDAPLISAKSTNGFGYTEGSATVVLPQETINISGYAEQMSGRFHIDKNTTYTVIINDDEYVITTGNVFGNYHYIGANPDDRDFSDYPFFIYTGFADTAKTPYFKHKDNGNYKVTVKLGSETIHKIDEKYLPSGAFVIDMNDDDFENKCSDPEFGLAVWKAFQSGQQIYICRGSMPNIQYNVVYSAELSRSCGPIIYLTLYFISSCSGYLPEGNTEEVCVTNSDKFSLCIDPDSITY